MSNTDAKTRNAKSFRGRSFAETIQKVTAELGKDAYIIEKRELKQEKSGLLRGFLGGDEMVEIIASAEKPMEAPEPQAPVNLLQKTYCRQNSASALSAVASPGEREERLARLPEQPSGSGLGKRLDDIDAKMAAGRERFESFTQEMRSLLSLQARGGLPPVGESLLAAYRQLVENEVAEDVAREMVERLQGAFSPAEMDNPEALRRALRESVSRLVSPAQPITLREGRPTVVALVGPAGVGKTTTLAKLAVEFVYRRNRSVGIINEDMRRPGADAQLRNLGHLLSLPIREVDNPSRVGDELEKLKACDLVLIDTAGRSPRSERALKELSDFLEAARPDETHLVLSGESSERSVLNAVEKFGEIGVNRVIFSKLDESAAYGLILNVAARATGLLSYVTGGQEYMENVLPAADAPLAEMILDGSWDEFRREAGGRW
jgi:flagellar biosynthesis protein FlhF